ncbi:MAG: DNA ligase D, partial [Pirellula sp.]|nr:DNA ligase D [Pirellula sp.]
MSLDEYRRKRNFNSSREPAGKIDISPGSIFVVQKHAASHLHYDLRLEVDGVLKSWALPKGPSLDPKVKRLAIEVEDHPLEYADFEGVIAEGNYGAGKVIVWDKGEWGPITSFEEGYKTGNIQFNLFGQKLVGKWVLVRIRPKDGTSARQWLLIKERDEHSLAESKRVITNSSPLSVLSGRDLADVKAAPKVVAQTKRSSVSRMSKPAVSKLSGAIRGPFPSRIDVQLATATTEIPKSEQWLHEIKLDGYRLLAKKDGQVVQLLTRNHQDWTHRFPSVAKAIQQVKCERFILDGELVALTDQGVSDFAALQSSVRDGQESKLVYYTFDILFADGYDLRNCRLSDRKATLQRILAHDLDHHVRYLDHIQGQGSAFFEKCRSIGLEGILSKKSDSKYISGRTDTWLKCKSFLADDFLIVGYLQARGSRTQIRSLILAAYDGDELSYCGKVGSGFGKNQIEDVMSQCKKLVRKKPVLQDIGELAKEPIVWLKPSLIARIHYIGWTDSKVLRHPVFKGLRTDIAEQEILRPSPGSSAKENLPRSLAAPPIDPEIPERLASLTLSNPDKIYYPKLGATKFDVMQYYVSVSNWILRYVSNRPTSLIRYPDGIEQESFFQKHPQANATNSMRSCSVDGEEFLEISDVVSLSASVQWSTIEFHPWSSRCDRPDRPDRVIFDLDPHSDVPWSQIVECAASCKQELEEYGLKSFVKTSGGKGLHIVVPIERRTTWELVMAFAKGVANNLVSRQPKLYTLNMSKRNRVSRILIDIHRNHQGATCAAAYSLRATPNATVSMPISWSDLLRQTEPAIFNIENVPN